ncbi:MAG: hypothetical protein ACRDV9_02540 [Acidimicrobiia bacterium]
MKPTVVVSGSVAQQPNRGGHTWAFFQYVLGFRRLGWDVVFLDRLEPEMCVSAGGHPSKIGDSANLRYFLDVMDRFGLADAFSLWCDRGRSVIGLSREEVLRRTGSSELLLNVMGFLTDDEVLGRARRRVFLDIDPGFGQMWHQLGLHDLFGAHDQVVTIGQRIGEPSCTIPECGRRWVTTPQPVVIEHWPVQPARPGPFTSVCSWRGPNGPVEYLGTTYGLRVHEFRKFADLPRRTRARLEIALDIGEADRRDIALLESNGWCLADPATVAADPWAYRAYIAASGAELMVAKNMYVTSRSGWFSDRSGCYLASGRPVVAQDTGLEGLYPIGLGLVTFSTPEEALHAIEEVSADYLRHARAAREIAEECLDSDKVLTRLLDRLDVADH